ASSDSGWTATIWPDSRCSIFATKRSASTRFALRTSFGLKRRDSPLARSLRMTNGRTDVTSARESLYRTTSPVCHRPRRPRPPAAHFPRREFAAVATHLQGAFEVPAPLLLARIAERGLDPHADSEVLDGLQVLEPSERLDRQREVVRVLLAGDVRERDAFPR